MNIPLNADEQVIWESAPAIDVNRHTTIMGKLLILILLVIGVATILFYGIGLIFWALAGYYYYHVHHQKNPFESFYYVLTNQRALLLNKESTGFYEITDQCDISKATALSQNKTHIAQGTQNQQTMHTVSNVIGDVAFLEGTTLKLKFAYVVDPDAVVKTAEEIKKSYLVG